MSYLNDQKKPILYTSPIPFYGWVEGPIMSSHLQGDCQTLFKNTAGTKVQAAMNGWKPKQNLVISAGLKKYKES
jgi:hypothetical protein